jgi:uncharacterized protein
MSPATQTETISSRPKNVLGTELQCCCTSPRTGFYRDGFCQTGPMDHGSHTVCAQVTTAFLEFSKSRGNDLSTPVPAYEFPGLNAGDRWCLCVSRWQEAFEAGVAPKIILESCHEKALEIVQLGDLKQYSLN